jgi:hypothetical protein
MAGKLREFLTTRRRLVWGAGAAVGAGAVGAAWVGAADPKDLVFGLVQRALPGVRLDHESVRQCAADVFARIKAQSHGRPVQRLASVLKLKGVHALSQLLGVGRVASLGPFEERTEEITRMAVSLLLTNSNFFAVADPTAETIYYTPPVRNSACGNPLANLGPPD